MSEVNENNVQTEEETVDTCAEEIVIEKGGKGRKVVKIVLNVLGAIVIAVASAVVGHNVGRNGDDDDTTEESTNE